MTPLFGGRTAEGQADRSESYGGIGGSGRANLPRHADEGEASARRGPARVRFVPEADSGPQGSSDLDTRGDGGAERGYDIAERTLLRKLRTRSLSVAEARTTIAGLVESADEAELLIEEFLRRGYLDDGALAEQLTHTAVTRKRQGRRAIGMELSRRGIPRPVADTVLAALPDDDDDRALDFARTKARGLRGVDREAALRRLVGQLSRRGFPSGVAMAAARTALDEVS